MNTETAVDTPEPSSTPEAKSDAVPTELAGSVEPGATDSAAPEGDESEAKPEKTAEQKELERLRRQLTKAQRNNGRLHQESLTYKQQLEQLTPREQQAEQSSTDPRVLAREIADIDKINEKADTIANAGKSKYPDFFDSLKTMVEEAGDMFDAKGKLTPLGNAIYEADVPAEDLIEFLGKNPDIASELEGLSPTKLGRKFAAIEQQMKAHVKPVSKASEPISPIRGGAGNVVKTLENMSVAEYKAHRAKQGARWAR